jgi:hypothetical protein
MKRAIMSIFALTVIGLAMGKLLTVGDIEPETKFYLETPNSNRVRVVMKTIPISAEKIGADFISHEANDSIECSVILKLSAPPTDSQGFYQYPNSCIDDECYYEVVYTGEKCLDIGDHDSYVGSEIEDINALSNEEKARILIGIGHQWLGRPDLNFEVSP